MYILEDLWNGKIRPDEKYARADTEYKRVLHELCEETDAFFEDLSKEKQQYYEKLEMLQYKLFNMSEQDSFIIGFRLGARMILDVVGEYKGQFMTPSDAIRDTK